MTKSISKLLIMSSVMVGISTMSFLYYNKIYAQTIIPYHQQSEEKALAQKLLNEGKITEEVFNEIKIIGVEPSKISKEQGDKEKVSFNQERDSKGTWMKSNGRWWFQYKDGHYSTAWDRIDNKWYYFDKDGWMKEHEWITSDGKWYYLTDSGAMAEGYLRVNNKPYYFIKGDGECIEDKGLAMAEYAKSFVGSGLQYVYGGKDLSSGVDCSGFMQAIHACFDIYIPRVTTDQAHGGVGVSSPLPGDLILYNSPFTGYNGHVGMYIGNGTIVHAANEYDDIKLMSVNGMQQSGAIRRYW